MALGNPTVLGARSSVLLGAQDMYLRFDTECLTVKQLLSVEDRLSLPKSQTNGDLTLSSALIALLAELCNTTGNGHWQDKAISSVSVLF